MAITSFDTLLDHVMPLLPGVSVELVRLELRNAAMRFCRESRIDQRDLTTFNTVASTADYTLTLPTDTAVTEILSVLLDAKEIYPLRPDEARAYDPTELGKPEQFHANKGGRILRLIKTPDVAYPVSVRVVLEPGLAATGVEDWIAQQYGRDIASGAIADLMAMPKKPWTDPATAGLHASRFSAAIISARDEADTGFSRAPTRTRSVFGLS